MASFQDMYKTVYGCIQATKFVLFNRTHKFTPLYYVSLATTYSSLLTSVQGRLGDFFVRVGEKIIIRLLDYEQLSGLLLVNACCY